MRQVEDEVWADVTLPGGEALPSVAAERDETPAQVPARAPVDDEQERERKRQEAVQRDRERAEAWEREKAERLYVEENGGWMLVDKYRKLRGKRDGEVWWTFDEMRRIQREQAEE